MKLEYRFRPANYWNIISWEVYNVILPFYINERPQRLLVTTVEEKE